MAQSARAARRRSPGLPRPPAMTDVAELAGVSHQTVSRVSGRTFGWSLSTRETVWCETPASRATSVIAGGRGSPGDRRRAARADCAMVDLPF